MATCALREVRNCDAMMSTDGDCTTHGAEKLCFKVNFDKLTFQVFDRKVDCLSAAENPLFVRDCDEWPTTGILLGCDCVKRIANCGFATWFNKVLPHLVTWEIEEIDAMLNKNTRFKMTDNCKMLVSKTVKLFRRAPVLDVNDKLVPMNCFDKKIDWGELT